jgi:hypothetical protein
MRRLFTIAAMTLIPVIFIPAFPAVAWVDRH